MSFIRRIKRKDRIYLAEVENRWINGKCVQKHIRYVGQEADDKTVLSTALADLEVEQVKAYGPRLVLDHLAQEIGLQEPLGEYGAEILSMVYAHGLDYKSINQMEQWFERTDRKLLLGIEGVTERRLLNALDSLESQDWERLQTDLFETVKARYAWQVAGVLYDVTNTYRYGKNCPLGKLGYDKTGAKGRPLIPIGLGVTTTEGIPLFHKVFDGNSHDARTLRDLVSPFRWYRLKSGMIIDDRGIVSARNISDFKELGWATLCGLPIKGTLKTTLRPLMDEPRRVRLSNRVRLNKTIFSVRSVPHRLQTVAGTLALCLNEQQRRDLRESRYDEIVNAQARLKQHQTIQHGLAKYFDGQGDLIHNAVQAAEEFDGYSCLFSTQRLSRQEMVRLYFDKDLVEKAFRSIQGVTRLQPVRHWLYNRVLAHGAIGYLAYLLLSLLKFRLKALGISPEAALRELDTMYKVYLRAPKKAFRIARVVTLSKKQEQILRAIAPRLTKT